MTGYIIFFIILIVTLILRALILIVLKDGTKFGLLKKNIIEAFSNIKKGIKNIKEKRKNADG